MAQLHSEIAHRSNECTQSRRPLVRKATMRVADVKQYNPMFEEEYVAGKDYDPDRCACLSALCKILCESCPQLDNTPS